MKMVKSHACEFHVKHGTGRGEPGRCRPRPAGGDEVPVTGVTDLRSEGGAEGLAGGALSGVGRGEAQAAVQGPGQPVPTEWASAEGKQPMRGACWALRGAGGDGGGAAWLTPAPRPDSRSRLRCHPEFPGQQEPVLAGHPLREEVRGGHVSEVSSVPGGRPSCLAPRPMPSQPRHVTPPPPELPPGGGGQSPTILGGQVRDRRGDHRLSQEVNEWLSGGRQSVPGGPGRSHPLAGGSTEAF